MELKLAASYFDKTSIDVYDDTAVEWSNSLIKGQFKLADDFISIFNRPTRRRMLFLSPDEYSKISNFSLIREPESGFLYLFGEPQHDLMESSYRTTLPLHKVRSQTTVNRRGTVGPTNDPGGLVDSFLTPVYADIELRTLTQEGSTDKSIYTKEFMWMQKDADVIKGDILLFEGITYRVLQTYLDTGFKGARITDEPDSRENVTYRKRISDDTYNNTTGGYTKNLQDFVIAVEIQGSKAEDDQGEIALDKTYTVLIEFAAIGSPPESGDFIVIDTEDREIIKVEREKNLASWKVVLR